MRDLGRRPHAAGASHWVGTAHWFADDHAAAAEALREGAEELDEMGEKAMLATSLGELSVALGRQGDHDAALEHSIRAEGVSASDDVAAQISWRVGRALALAGLGRVSAASVLADEAIGLSDAGYPIDKARIRVDLVDVIRQSAGTSQALRRLAEARLYFEHKGALPVVERIDRRIDQLAAQGVGDASAAGA